MAATTTVAAEVATTSAPHESFERHGRPGDGAAAARTELLYAQYGRTVSGLCGALLRNRAEAEDAAQQTFLSAHRALRNGTDPREPAAWLATIARNECWGRIRSRMREPLASDEIDAVSTAPDPLAEAIRRADLAALWAAIEALPLQQRDAILLREFGGLSYDELAVALAVSGAAVESLLFRARQKLRAQLRTAYASLTGASWIDALARLLAGGSAPVAAKVAALGVGAAAISGGAVVAPQVLENHHPRPPSQSLTAPRHRVRHVQVAAPVVERHALVPARTVASVPTTSTSGGDEGRAPDRAGRSSGSGRADRHLPPPKTRPPSAARNLLPVGLGLGLGLGFGAVGGGPRGLLRRPLGPGDGSSGSGDDGGSGSGDGGGSHYGGESSESPRKATSNIPRNGLPGPKVSPMMGGVARPGGARFPDLRRGRMIWLLFRP